MWSNEEVNYKTSLTLRKEGEYDEYTKKEQENDYFIQDDWPLLSLNLNEILKLFQSLIFMAIPASISQVIMNISLILNIYFFAYNSYPTGNIVALAVSTLVFQLMGEFLMSSLASGLYELAKKRILYGDYVEFSHIINRGIVLNLINTCIVVLTLFLVSTHIIDFLIEEEDYNTIKSAQSYIIYLCPSLVGFMCNDTLRNFLYSLKVFQIPISVLLPGFAIHLSLCFFLSVTGFYDELTAAMSKIISDYIHAYYIYQFLKSEPTFQRAYVVQFTWPQFYDLLDLFCEQIKYAYSFYIETFTFDLITVFACFIGTLDELQGQVILVTISNINYFIAMGITQSVYQYVNKCIEEGWLNKGKNFTFMAVALMIITSLFDYFLLVSFQTMIAKFFVGPHIILAQYFKNYCHIYYYLLFVDNQLNILTVVLKCLQKVHQLVAFHYFFYYFIGIPLSLIMAFSFQNNQRVEGLWLGYCISECIFLLFLVLYLCKKIDWDIEIAKVRSAMLLDRARYV